MAFEELTLITVPGHETWKGFSMAIDVPNAARCLWEAQQLQRVAKTGGWDNLPMAQLYENVRKMFYWVGQMFRYMNTSPWNSALWENHFHKWHGTLLWQNPYGCGHSTWSYLVPTDPEFLTKLQAGPKVAFASGGRFSPIECVSSDESGAPRYAADPALTSENVIDCWRQYYPSIFGQRIRQAAQAIKGDPNGNGAGLQFGGGHHIVMFTLNQDGTLIAAPSGAVPANSEPQYDFTGLYNGAGCCYYTWNPLDDRLSHADPSVFAPTIVEDIPIRLPTWVDTTPPVEQLFQPPVVTQYREPNVQTDIPIRPLNTQFVTPNIGTMMPMQGRATLINSPPLQLTPVQPSGGIMGAPWVPSGGCCGGASGRVNPSGFVTGTNPFSGETIDPANPNYDPGFPISPDGRITGWGASASGQTPQYGWTRSACDEIASDATDTSPTGVKYGPYCFRWNDAPLNFVRFLPPLRWALDEGIEMVDTMSSIPIWDHVVRARVRQLLEMVKQADRFGVPGAQDPLDAPALVLQQQQEALAEYQKLSRINPKDSTVVTTDAVVGTAVGVLAAIPGMQVAALAIGALYAIGRFFATLIPLPYTYGCDQWGRPLPSVWPSTIFDPLKPIDQQIGPAPAWSASIGAANGPAESTLRALGGVPEKPILPAPPDSLPDLQDWMKAYKEQQEGKDGAGIGTALVVAGVTAVAVGAAWWLGTRGSAGTSTPRKNPTRRVRRK